MTRSEFHALRVGDLIELHGRMYVVTDKVYEPGQEPWKGPLEWVRGETYPWQFLHGFLPASACGPRDGFQIFA